MSDLEQLLVGLDAESASGRMHAIQRSTAYDKPTRSAFLLKALEHWDRKVREKSAKILLKIGGDLELAAVCSAVDSRKVPLLRLIPWLARRNHALTTRTIYNLTQHSHKVISEAASKYLIKMDTTEALFYRWSKQSRIPKKLAAQIEACACERVASVLSDIPVSVIHTLRGKFLRYPLLKKYYHDKYSDSRPQSSKETVSPKAPKVQSEYVQSWNKLGIDWRIAGWIVRNWSDLDDVGYFEFKIPKKNGTERIISAPVTPLKIAQRVVLDKILSTVPQHDACHGFRKNFSIITNATKHTGKDVVIRIDLKDFFPSIKPARIAGIFRSLGFSDFEIRFLTRVTTRGGGLPQGAPSSPCLANIVARRLDSRLNGLAASVGGTYTRYADDLIISGHKNVVSILPAVKSIIQEEDFGIASEKLRIARKGAQQKVTGLIVNQCVNAPRELRRKLRAVFHKQSKGEVPYWGNKPMSESQMRGYQAFLSSIEKSKTDQHEKL
ncbi:reverse transcriptase domain-containing protein [Fundidesulfovibrio soli]|uniref:reverse transcriptase domain-containing protein n=1 Tax=Fundidesulfovibrio soli TaxID=2922716 RepID=UPI001FAFF4E1|nr:reverse transcriptase domain-containing protein [Fundidesulfovibrio soli]